MASVDEESGTATPGIDRRVEIDSGRPLTLDDSVGPVPIGAGWDAEPAVLDWFGAGRPDLLVASGGGPRGHSARVYRALDPTGDQPIRYDEGTEVEALDGLRRFCPIPNGGPTRFDLVALAAGGLVLVRNTGTEQAPRFGSGRIVLAPPGLGIGVGQVAQLVAEDWDGDGATDLLIGFDDLTGYWPDSPAVPETQQVGFDLRGAHPGYDRRGAWRGRPPRGRLFWMRNVGTPGAPRFAPPEEIEPEATQRLAVAARPAFLTIAWGGGRAWELLLTDASGAVRLYRNFGGQRPPVLLEPRPVRVQGQPLTLPADRTSVVAADLDGDGRAELVFGRSDGRLFFVHAAPGRDAARPPEPLLHEGRTLWLGGRAVLTAGDFDADGDVDLVAGDGPGRLWMVEDFGGPGEHRYGAPVEIEALGSPFRLDSGPDGQLDGPVAPRLGYACPALVDWNGNGRPDLIVGGAGGEVLLLHNNGGPTEPRFDRPNPVRCEGLPLVLPPRVRPAAARWTGGELPDLIALDIQGLLCVYPRTDLMDVGAPVPLADRLGRAIRLDGAFGQAGKCALWAGPWTGSGRIDLLVGLPCGSRFVLPALTGTPLTDVDDLPTVLLLEHVGDNVLIPRPLRLTDGCPLVVGSDGCSPCGVDWAGRGTLDLLVGSDDGRVFPFRREHLLW